MITDFLYEVLVVALIISGLIASAYSHFAKQKSQLALILLLITGLAVRLYMASIDPFLHTWDERFHALVARNLIDYPLKPMLRVDAIMPYKIEDWCCNHIWVHKQPLFLYQMALSMKVFGVNEVAMRLPSALMGTASIYFIYDIARKWLKNTDIAFLAALFFTISYYHLELTAGRLPVDHNDLAFTFYVTASIWAFMRYIQKPSYKWALLIGFLVGCAVLNKWLTGYLVIGAWGLYLLIESYKSFKWLGWKHLIIALIVSIAVFLPWQVYILTYFPVEAHLMYEHNKLHIFEVLGDIPGSIWFHFKQAIHSYGVFMLIFLPFGIYHIFSDKSINRNLSISMLAMVVVIYVFFSFIVKTKMPAFTFPVNAVIWISISAGIIFMGNMMIEKQMIGGRKVLIIISTVVLLAVLSLKPWQIYDGRTSDNLERTAKIHNTEIYKNIDLSGDLADRVILNCKTFEETDFMFYRDVNAYMWYPTAEVLDSLIDKGYRFAAFKNHNNQVLPDYIHNNNDIIIIDEQLW